MLYQPSQMTTVIASGKKKFQSVKNKKKGGEPEVWRPRRSNVESRVFVASSETSNFSKTERSSTPKNNTLDSTFYIRNSSKGCAYLR